MSDDFNGAVYHVRVADENFKGAIYHVKVIDGGLGGHDKGYFATPTALREAYPTAEPGDHAIVETTDTVWVWDSDTNAWKDSDQKGQVTSVNGATGDVTVQPTLVSGTNIKTINGNSILGSGDLKVSGFQAYPAGWTTNSTTKAFCDDIAADASAIKGMAYLGEVTCSDLPASIANSEIKVFIDDGTTAADKIIVLEMTSGNVAPYQWQYTYWNGGSNVSGWIATGAQVNADWNANSGVAQILNKPTIPAAQVNSDWNANSGVAQILNKPTIPTTAQQVGAVPQYTTMPVASVQYLGQMAQYAGESTEDYECGWFYLCGVSYDNATATISQTTGSGLSDLTVDAYTFAEYESASTDETVNFVWSDSDSSWTKDGETVDITDYGITYSGTPTDGDVLTVVLTMGYAWESYWVQEWPIDDGSTAEDKTWSADKLNTMIGDIETLLSQI